MNRVSFASKVKEEILSKRKDDDLLRAELSALYKTSGILIMRQGQYVLKFATENVKLAKYMLVELKHLYNIPITTKFAQDMKLYKNFSYILEIEHRVDYILSDLNLSLNLAINILPKKDFLNNDEKIRTYLCGVFLSSGSVNAPESTNYHLEMALNDEDFAKYLVKLCENNFDFHFKIINRRGMFVMYLKKSDQIADFLKVIGASNAVLYYEDIRATRDFKNNYNRLNNCLIANDLKSIANAKEQIRLINIIDQHLGLENLEDRLKDIALVRIENEDSSLSELADIYYEKTGISLSKSGVNHRLKELEKIAKKYL